MAIINRIADFHGEMTEWRRDFHANPELGFQEQRTSEIVAAKLAEWGIEVHKGIGRTGVVGVLRAGNGDRRIGLRADMDALPITERTGKDYASGTDGVMHACGHDGHTTMLLGAAKYLAETKNFDGTVHFIFQPAEEGLGGAFEMLDDGLFERFPCERVYGMHNMPNIPVGEFAIRTGPIMAAGDTFEITIQGRGSHAAMPHQGVDPVVVGSNLIIALQTLVSRTVSAQDALVVSVTEFHAGEAFNVIPDTVVMRGTCRTLNMEIHGTLEERFRRVVDGICAAHGASATVDYKAIFPVTVNAEDATQHALGAARAVAGDGRVRDEMTPLMGSEDFAAMMVAVPGSYILMGNGPGASVHHPEYDFNDEALTHGASYWSTLVEQRLAKA
ncbi:M20 aminoacylase family protein [Thalassobaculum litoreum]|uniref:Hippurate hydrolase n=1 Tax=Thalassobaculum litoreum DSM 18839 TaxID=1123362 RepID=A0A8G2BGP6_9PROT|nr:M20 aminoacylase family protein [Thalassobaculum litoreum]SDF58500.1 hippurate hydrolase [Thalassobaculum litoreum DSM 18839]